MGAWERTPVFLRHALLTAVSKTSDIMFEYVYIYTALYALPFKSGKTKKVGKTQNVHNFQVIL